MSTHPELPAEPADRQFVVLRDVLNIETFKRLTQRICSVLFRARLDRKRPPPKPDRRSEFQACCGTIVKVLPEITTLDGPKRLGRLVSAMHRAYDLLPLLRGEPGGEWAARDLDRVDDMLEALFEAWPRIILPEPTALERSMFEIRREVRRQRQVAAMLVRWSRRAGRAVEARRG
jgi:hypothetical protein